MDQTDSLSQRDTGWIQLYCQDGQELFDTILQAYRLAEKVNLPVMVVLDAFFLSHTFEPVDVPDQDAVDRFLPPFSPRIELNTKDPFAVGQMAAPTIYMEMRHSIQNAMEQVAVQLAQVEQEFEAIFNRKYGPLEAIHCDDAQIIMVVTGTAASTCRKVISDLRSQGEKVGMLKLRMFRPFPTNLIRQILGSVQKVAVLDRNFSFGASGIFAQEIRAALCNSYGHPPVFGFIAGLGGRDVTPETLSEIYWKTQTSDTPESDSIWVGLKV